MSAYDDDNIFAKILRGEIPCHKVYEDDVALAFMDVMPQGEGHTLVIPKKSKARNVLEMEPDELAALMPRVQKVAKAAKAAFGADGVMLIQYNEPAAGQTVFHPHFHVIPRFADVPLKPHSGKMADGELLKAHAAKIVAAL
ncbi:hypothetical protein RHAL1_01415 [Beijerinckiaceae bacterium RH AL1]|jgi:histidine triad (HIT) family protein|nr:HIT family protein [Beijerinckiaceae bacterium]VVB44750.1 hypothetical protein RHCH11_RHCH11_01381 [Beijerinckiaceae bacterium RH CH11]VVB44828.1 hypothetical protein RHAL8_01378 [Beijerinckiaceae bacterium RH AL8]VVC54517.1 hypothetical protein RHAL1_01415 [Beijerinckiaceae bacterium RH AL1]